MPAYIRTGALRAPALAALLAAAACSDAPPLAPDASARLEIFAAERGRQPASAEWSAVARGLVASKQNNAFQAVRNFATLNLAQYQAVLAADAASHGRRPASRRAAEAAAAAGALAYLYPGEGPALEAQVAAQVATPGWLEPGAPDVEAGLAAGRAAAEAIVARARTDGFYDPFTGTVPTGPGKWYSMSVPPAPPGGAGFVGARTFFLASPSQFRPAAPPAFDSPAFATALAEVRQITDARTAEQDSLSRYWALPPGTIGLAGWWNREASELAAAHRFDERRAAQLLALSGAAAYDALIACNDAKYTYWLLRPSQADPAIKLAIALPNFPSYPSNTACISAAEAAVIGARVPSERHRLDALAEQAAASRIYAGIHFRFDGEAGLEIGRRVAREALAVPGGRYEPLPPR
ncbi:vanadium-dependent haloperoxidase [Roseisolibacter sp. H3M3-2]|uniref:vanadium-dependent haloperoxidase n=1 Tax=Roseisolibacter sp. H3M3-2 TaxID=3031323 RepID=UPI0023DB61A2|nr:vanadium-dependent haloperoxidase [Roseisolibacter sp. H3M3-2]MDF1503272.1 vanadium-dependent haloperoxidase [Roseisolibacter sp. H3M3-2]